MEISKCKRKFKLLFDKFFQENFELSSYHSEKLLKYLDGDDKYAGKILDTPFFSDLILYSLTNLENTKTSVKIFFTEVITIVLKNELQFCKVAQLQGFTMMAQKLRIFKAESSTALHLAGVKGIISQISHYSGTMWLVQNKVWTHMLRPNVHHKSTKVAQADCNCISKLVWKLNEYEDEAALTEVLKYIVEPIKSSEYMKVDVIHAENEKSFYDPILPFINTLLAIVKDSDLTSSQNKVFNLISRYFIIEPVLYKILLMTRNLDLVCLLSEFNFTEILVFCKSRVCNGVQGNRDIPSEVINEYCNYTLMLLEKRMPSASIFFAVRCAVIWTKMATSHFPETFERHGRTFHIRNQFMMLIITPLMIYTYHTNVARNNSELMDALDVFCIKLDKISSEHIVKAAYSFRELIESGDQKKIALLNLKEIFKLQGCLNEAQAGMLYQALYYTLKIHVITDGSGALILNENPLKTPDDVKLLSLVLEAIRMLLNEHNINWYENVEIYGLQTTLMDLLKQNFMPIKQLLQAMNLIDLSIKRFLSPDMALLMESKRGSTLNEIGAIMQSYIQHDEWEVRDSALHMLLSCIEAAFVKYLPLRSLLSDNKLIVLAAQAALDDTEFYVQATALRCLGAATKIESIWREVLIGHPNLYNQLIYILRYNSEGIVRKEAANVLTEIYVNQKLSTDFTKGLFNVMADGALNDLHWEVQIAALHFWKNVIHNQMSNRGMIDGKFPSVTFSKEKRKIIILNDKEIMKQLIEIVNNLSAIGCLTVLHRCLKEEYNIEVMEQAYGITKGFVKILDYYKFEGVPDNFTSSNVLSTQTCDNSGDISLENIGQNFDEAMDLTSRLSSQMDEMELREKIIETIVNNTDYDLIVACYENFSQMKPNMVRNIIPPPIENMIHPNIFLKSFKDTDYSAIIDDKKNWSSGPKNLDLLLDEILSATEICTDITSECN